MSSVPPRKRVWNCPDCGGEVLLSMTQLDPLACPACVTKLKGGSSSTSAGSSVTGAAGGPLQIAAALPESVKLAAVGIVALLLGLLIGFVAGRVTAPQSASPTQSAALPGASSPSDSTRSKERDADSEDPSEESRPGHKWVKSYTRKDGVNVKGYWSRDSNSGK